MYMFRRWNYFGYNCLLKASFYSFSFERHSLVEIKGVISDLLTFKQPEYTLKTDSTENGRLNYKLKN